MPSMSYRELSNWISLVALLVAGTAYFHEVFSLHLAGEQLDGRSLLRFGIGIIVLLVGIEIVLHLVAASGFAAALALGADERTMDAVAEGTAVDEPADERDRFIDLLAHRNAWYLLDTGALMAAAVLFTHEDRLFGMQFLLLALVLSQAVKYGSRLYFYRRGAF